MKTFNTAVESAIEKAPKKGELIFIPFSFEIDGIKIKFQVRGDSNLGVNLTSFEEVKTKLEKLGLDTKFFWQFLEGEPSLNSEETETCYLEKGNKAYSLISPTGERYKGYRINLYSHNYRHLAVLENGTAGHCSYVVHTDFLNFRKVKKTFLKF